MAKRETTAKLESDGGFMRAFVAVMLPRSVAEALAPSLDALRAAEIRGLRPVDARSAHLTVHFLGRVPLDLTARLGEALSAAAATVPAFRLRVGEPGAFPSAHRPSVLWAGLIGDLRTADRLHAAVTEAFTARGVSGGVSAPHDNEAMGVSGGVSAPHDNEAGFMPHVTLARLGRAATPAERRRAMAVLLASPPRRVGFDVNSISLVRSFLDGRGARYETVFTAELAVPPA